jgi:hypothetical protein
MLPQGTERARARRILSAEKFYGSSERGGGDVRTRAGNLHLTRTHIGQGGSGECGYLPSVR